MFPLHNEFLFAAFFLVALTVLHNFRYQDKEFLVALNEITVPYV